ncbi:MAG TPA: protein kinase, partial [Bryobacteraceae bacterium]|nr:protein kinase [Bryobacteraceae bacterium]
MPEAAPQRIGKYEIQAELGRGGFGRVYRAFDPRVGRLVAVKVLDAANSRDLITRFKNEAAAAGKLQHRNIVTLYEFGEDNGVPFIAMEHLEGEDLQQVIAAGKSMTLLQKMDVMAQVAEGLDCAHRNGIVHRDVKPGNIRLLPDGTVKIMDFGIARLLHDTIGTRLTRQGHVIGTLLYMSPEQLLGSDVDSLCDIFAYGVTYYEFLTGVNPHQTTDPRVVFYKITNEEPPPIRTHLPDCPEALEQAVRRALHKERDLRYQTLRDFLFDTEPLQLELRQERAAALLVEARTLVEAGELEAAQARLAEALDLDPSNRGARQLREAVQSRLRRRTLKPRIDALTAKADAAIEAGKYAEAAESLELARQLDPGDDALQNRLRETRALVERARRAAQLVAEARVEFSRQNLAGALQKASEALEADPKSAEAGTLLSVVQKELDERERRRRLEERLREARELLLLGSFDEAAAALESLETAQKRSDDVKELLARIRAHKADAERQERLRSELSSARELVDRLRFAEAVDLLRKLKTEFPAEERVSGLLTYAQQELLALERAQALDALRTEVLAHAEAHEFDAALEKLRAGIEAFQNDPGLARLRQTVLTAKAKWERKQAVEAAFSSAESLRAQNLFAEALEALEAPLSKYPDAAELTSLRQRIAADQDRYKRAAAARQALDRAEASLAEGDPAAAVQFLEAAVATGDPRIPPALSTAREALESRRRADAIERIRREVRAAVEAWQFTRAVEIAQRGLKAFPGEPALEQIKAETIARQEQWEREQAIAAALRNAAALRAQLRFADALAALEACLARYPGEQRLTDLHSRIDADWQQHKRAEAVATAAAAAQSLLEHGQATEALDGLRHALEQFPGDKTLLAEAARAEAALREQRRVETMSRAEAQVEAALSEKRFDAALEIIAECRRDWPGEPALASLYEKAAAAKAGHEKQVAIAAALESSEALTARGAFTEALAALDAALRRYPGDPGLKEARSAVETAWERRRRLDAIGRAIADAGRLRAEGDPRTAADLLRRAASRHGSDPELSAALSDAEEEVAAQERAEAVSAAVSEAAALRGRKQFDRAISVLDAALSSYPGDAALCDARETTVTAKSDWERETEIAAAVKAADQCLRDRRFDEARGTLAAALLKYPGAETLTRLSARVQAEAEAAARRQAIARAVAGAVDLVNQGEPSQAVQALETALTNWPNEPDVEQALSGARAAEARQRRERAIQKALAAANEALESGEPAHAIELLERASAETAAAAEIQDALRAARAELERLDRERAIQHALAQADRALQSGDPAAALSVLQQAREQLPESAAIGNAIRNATAELARREREQAVQAASETARAHLDAKRFDDALTTLQSALRHYPGDPALTQLEQTVTTAKAEAERHERDRAIQFVAETARAHIDAHRFEDALATLASALTSYPGEAALTELQRQAAAAKAEAERRERERVVQAAAETARNLLAARQFDNAVATLDAALHSYPRAATLWELRQQVLAAKAAHDRQQAIDGAARRAEELIGAGRLAQAAQELQAALKTYPEDATLLALHARLQREWETRKRADAVSRAVAAANRLLDQNQPERAAAQLEAAAAQYPDEPALIEAISRATAAVHERRRADAIESACRQTRLHLDRREFDRAMETVERSLQTYGGEARLTSLQQTVLHARTEWRRSRTSTQRTLAAGAHPTDSAVTDEVKVPPQLQIDETRFLPALEPPERLAERPPIHPPPPPPTERHRPEPLRSEPPVAVPQAARPSRRIPIIAAALAIIALVAAWFVWQRMRAAPAVIEITSEPSGVTVNANGTTCTTPNCRIEAQPGALRIDATLPGFEPYSQTLTIEKGSTAPFLIRMTALSSRVQVSSNVLRGEVAVNGRPAGALADGQLTQTLQPGRHELRIRSSE